MITKEFLNQINLPNRAVEFAVTLIGLEVREAARRLDEHMARLFEEGNIREYNEFVRLSRHITHKADWGFEEGETVRYRISNSTARVGEVLKIEDGKVHFADVVVSPSLVSSVEPEQLSLFEQ
ncbi:hypothetical protein HMPREF9372_3376 [Sporosarcina newyorkensis 2681]|uniref:Uncharacterized protein n=1 Tax=Sporosarcina newyorkensis 2681 TaxID=1027292 RepID=F9DX45_9BACL|nr:hypothetical protein [Sporosarcina newyorkensis]EGQ21093.1 hypothetical protein HMPREF9372_3376 [Sporosarcina newyorkensis 2681]